MTRVSSKPTSVPRARTEPAARQDAASGSGPGGAASKAGTDAAPLGALDGVLGFHLARAAAITGALFERHVGSPHELRKVEFSLLQLLLAHDGLAPKQLGQALSLSAPNLTLWLDRLEQRGLVRRERNQADRRSHRVVLTDAGSRLARRCAQALPEMERDVRDRLSHAEHLMLIELLRKIARP